MRLDSLFLEFLFYHFSSTGLFSVCSLGSIVADIVAVRVSPSPPPCCQPRADMPRINGSLHVCVHQRSSVASALANHRRRLPAFDQWEARILHECVHSQGSGGGEATFPWVGITPCLKHNLDFYDSMLFLYRFISNFWNSLKKLYIITYIYFKPIQ